MNYPSRAVARLRQFAAQLGGRFWLWKAGTGGHLGTPFAHGAEHERFGVMAGARLPHMFVSFGHLSRILGVRMVPEQWHRSQRVDVGGRRSFRLFVADGGEAAARAFFRPRMVELFERVGRSYDVEIRNRSLYLFAGRSPAAGSERRWGARRRLLEAFVGELAESEVWEAVGRQSQRLRGLDHFVLRAEPTRQYRQLGSLPPDAILRSGLS